MSSNKKSCSKLLNLTIIILTVSIGVFISLITPYPLASKIILFAFFITAIATLIFTYIKYKAKNKSNKTMLLAELVCTILLFLLYLFGYERFTAPNTINIIFIILSIVLFFPIIIDIALNKK